MPIYFDISAAVHRRAGLGRYAESLARALLPLLENQLAFFKVHEEADLDHSNMGWKAVADFAEKYGMEEQAVHACEINLRVWELYFNGIADAGDRLAA